MFYTSIYILYLLILTTAFATSKVPLPKSYSDSNIAGSSNNNCHCNCVDRKKIFNSDKGDISTPTIAVEAPFLIVQTEIKNAYLSPQVCTYRSKDGKRGRERKAPLQPIKRNSPCLNCMVCLAVVEKLYPVIKNLADNFCHVDPDTYKKHAEETLRNFCATDFNHHQLKQYSDFVFLSDIKSNDERAKTLNYNFEGCDSWPKILQATCFSIVDYIDVLSFRHPTFLNYTMAVDYLCKEGGASSHCRNIHFGPFVLKDAKGIEHETFKIKCNHEECDNN